MLTLRFYGRGLPLYDGFFSHFGPFFFNFYNLIYGAFGFDLTHDVSRGFSVLVRAASCIVAGAIVLRTLKSYLAASLALLLTAFTMAGMSNEPGHPQDLVSLLIALIAIIPASSSPRSSAWHLSIWGSLTAALVLTKINAGVLALIPSLLICLYYSGSNRLPRSVTFFLYLAALLLPFALTWNHLDSSSLRLSLLVSISLFLLFLFCPKSERRYPLLPFLLGFVVLLLFFLAHELSRGTSIREFILGALSAKSPILDAERLQLDFSPYFLPSLAASALFGIVFFYSVRNRKQQPPVIRLLQLLVSTYFLLVQTTLHSLPDSTLALPWCWLFVNNTSEEERFQTWTISLLLIFQLLLVFPLAGSQTNCAMTLGPALAVIMFIDTVRVLRESFCLRSTRAAISILVALSGIIAVYSFSFHFFEAYLRYAANAPLSLPGSKLLRLAPSQASNLRKAVSQIGPEDTLFTVPGLYSFYFWADKESPTTFTVSPWIVLFQKETLKKIESDLEAKRHLTVIWNDQAYNMWTYGRRLPDNGELLNYLRRRTREVQRAGDYTILKEE